MLRVFLFFLFFLFFDVGQYSFPFKKENVLGIAPSKKKGVSGEAKKETTKNKTKWEKAWSKTMLNNARQ